jgi:hypothetical protein
MLSLKLMSTMCSLKTLGGKSFVSGSIIIFSTDMLKTNGLILDFLFHNIKSNINVLGRLYFFIVMSIKYYWLIVTVYH